MWTGQHSCHRPLFYKVTDIDAYLEFFVIRVGGSNSNGKKRSKGRKTQKNKETFFDLIKCEGSEKTRSRMTVLATGCLAGQGCPGRSPSSRKPTTMCDWRLCPGLSKMRALRGEREVGGHSLEHGGGAERVGQEAV